MIATRFPDLKKVALDLLTEAESGCDEKDKTYPREVLELDECGGDPGYGFWAFGTVEFEGGVRDQFKLRENYSPGTYWEPDDYEIEVAYLSDYLGSVREVVIEGDALRAAQSIGVVLDVAKIVEKLFWYPSKDGFFILCSKPGWRIVCQRHWSKIVIAYKEVPNVESQDYPGQVLEVQAEPRAGVPQQPAN